MLFLLYLMIDKYLTFLIFICEYLYEYLFLKNYWNWTISIKNIYLQRFFKYVFFIVFFMFNNILILILIYSYLYAGFFFILVSIRYLNKHLFVKWCKKCFLLFLFLYLIGWLSFLLYANWLFIYKFYKFYKSEYNCWPIKTVNEEISFFFSMINIYIYKNIIVTYFNNSSYYWRKIMVFQIKLFQIKKIFFIT